MNKNYFNSIVLVLCCVMVLFANNMFAQDPTRRGHQESTPTVDPPFDEKRYEKLVKDGMITPPSPPVNGGTTPPSNGPSERCSTDAAMEALMQDPARRAAYEARMTQFSQFYDPARVSIPCDANNTFVVPVAVHFSPAFDCSNTACLIDATNAQIESMNADFAATNADLASYFDIVNNCGAPDVASDGACITFCVATQNHPASSGIPDGMPAITVGEYNGGLGDGGTATNGEWPGVLNIFVTGGGAGGVADAIGGAFTGDGVTVTGGVFGGPDFTACSSGSTIDDGGGVGWDLGRTLTHEVGHYLGLWHTFQSSTSTTGCGGDEPASPFAVNDTPQQSVSSSGCPGTGSCAALDAGCGNGEFLQFNFMDYYDDPCLVMFTNDQVVGMNQYVAAAFANNEIRTDACVTGATFASLAACSLTAAFTPADGATLTLCTDDGANVQFSDASTNGPVSWDWTFTVTGGDITLSAASSTMQNPVISATGGTSGTVEVTLEVCDAGATCDQITQTYTVNVVSGADCPNECDYTLNLTDDYGDGWNGATVEVFQNGTSIGVFGGGFTAGASDGPYTLVLTDGAAIDVVQTNGGFPGEEGFTILDPFGNIVAELADGNPVSQSFTASCTLPTCDDGMQNGSETGIDCGGTTCDPCPVCPDGYVELLREGFDACALPAGWSTSHTGVGNTIGTCNDGTSGFSFDCTDGYPDSSTGGPSAGFDGCVGVFNDDNLGGGEVGIGCITIDAVELALCTNAALSFDWQNEDAGGGTLSVTVDGVEVFSASGDDNGSEISIPIAVGATSQISFCYDDDGSWAWGFAIDNVVVCCEESLLTCPSSAEGPSEEEICDGDAPTVPSIDGTLVDPNGNAVAWSVGGNPATGTLVADYDWSNATCAPIEVMAMAYIECDSDGDAGTPDIWISLNVTHTVTIYPSDISAFVGAVDGGCGTSVSVDPACVDADGNPTVTYSPADQTETAEGIGTHAYTATWAGGGSCNIPDVNITANYDCPNPSECGTLLGVSQDVTAVCGDGTSLVCFDLDVEATGGEVAATYSGELDATSPTFNRPFGNPCTLSGSGTDVYYDVLPFTVSTSGNYTFAMTSFPDDGHGGIYAGSFDPADPCATYIVSDDDGNGDADPLISGVSLTAGVTYYLVTTTFGNGAVGAFDWAFTGDGNIIAVTANFGFNWSSASGTLVSGDGTASACFSFTTANLCEAETATVEFSIDCLDDDGNVLGELDAGDASVDVYPLPPADPADLANYVMISGENTCDEPMVTPIAGCETAITVTGDAGNPAFPAAFGDSGTATYEVTFAHAGGPDCCPDASGGTMDIILDGGFESGAPGNGWTEFSTEPFAVIDGTFPITGSFDAWLGGLAAGSTYVEQTITIPATAVSADLSFNVAAGACDCAGGDTFDVTINGTVVWSLCNPVAGQVEDESTICNDLTNPDLGIFVTPTIDVSAFADGNAYVLQFFTEEVVDDGNNTSIFVDDVALIVEEPAGADPCVGMVTADYDCAAPTGCEIDLVANPLQGSNGGISPFAYNSIELVVSGGVAPYTYEWDAVGYVRNAVVGNGEIRILYADNAQWAVTVTDALGCQVVFDDFMGSGDTTTDLLDIQSVDVTPATLSGACQDGSITVVPEGGSGAYTYNWEGPFTWDGTGQSTATITGPRGWYSVTVSDGTIDTYGWYWINCSLTSGGGRGKVANDNVAAYPNPFTTATNIEFSVAESGTTSVAIYTIDGKKVVDLFKGDIEAGVQHRIDFEAGPLPNGLYMIELMAPNGGVSYEKLMLQK